MSSVTDREFIEDCAKVVLDFVGSLDPVWKDRIEIARTERRWNHTQIVGAFCGQALERGEHLIIPLNPFFEPGFVPSGESTTCAECGDKYTPSYGGQPVCLKPSCGKSYWSRNRDKLTA